MNRLRARANEAIPTSWVTNALLLLFIAVVSYAIILAFMWGTSQRTPEQPQHPGVVISESAPTSQT